MALAFVLRPILLVLNVKHQCYRSVTYIGYRFISDIIIIISIIFIYQKQYNRYNVLGLGLPPKCLGLAVPGLGLLPCGLVQVVNISVRSATYYRLPPISDMQNFVNNSNHHHIYLPKSV